MKLIIKNDNRDIVKNPNIKIIETTKASFTNQIVFIEENDVPIIKYTDTKAMYFVKDLDNLYDRKSKSEVLLDITIDNLEAIDGDSGAGIESVTGDYVDNSDPLNPILNDPRPYKVYTALLTQSGTDAPVATVLENTLGDIEYSRDGIGSYSIVSNGLFIVGKTTIEFGVLNLTDAVSGQIMLSDELTPNENEFQIYTRTTAFENQDGFTNVKIEIRVYN